MTHPLIELRFATKNTLLLGPFRLVAFSTRGGKYVIAHLFTCVRACVYIIQYNIIQVVGVLARVYYC